MTLDPATTRFIEELAEAADADARPIHEMTPEEARAFSESLAALAGPAPQMTRVSEHTLERTDGNVRLRVLLPIERPAGVIVYYHGGGWVVGSIEESDTLARKLAERTSCAVVLVGYRLAPEHRYPVAVDDAYAALEWTGAHLDEIAGDGAPAVRGGRQRRGQPRRRRGRPRARPQRPGDRDADSRLPRHRRGLRPALVHGSRERVAADEGRDDLVLGPLPARRSPALRARCLAAARTADLVGLPPAVVLTAEHDVLRDEGEAYAQRLADAGVPVDFQRHARQMHGFFTLLMLPGSERGFQHVVKAVRACIVRQPEAAPAVHSR